MKIRVRLAIATLFGVIVATGLAIQAQAQVGLDNTGNLNPGMATGVFGPYQTGGLQQAKFPPQGVWAEIISVNAPWIVIQNQAGQEFPIAADQVGQFLIRWPSTTNALTNRSIVEVTGPESASNTIIADHLDVYEGGDQNLVSPAVNNLYGLNRTLTPFDIDQQSSYGVVYYMSPEESAIPSRTHIVGPFVGDGTGAVRVAGFGQNWYNIQPSVNGMSVTQVTRGNISFAKPGDLVYLLPERVTPRSVVISQLVLYKKMPLNRFQP